MRVSDHVRLLAFGLAIHMTGLLAAQGPPPRPAAAGPAVDDQAVLDRYRGALERNPRRGTALDRLYGLHVEQGRLDQLIDGYRDRAKKSPGDGVAWMILGLLEAQRGRDSAAVPAFREAERLRPDDPLASYYLGQSMVLTGQPRTAVDAFERAIKKKPASRNDLLEMYQALGRVHQRDQRVDEALAVWRRLEDQFPDDVKVRERVARALLEDGQVEPRSDRYQALAARGDDRLRQPLYRATAAELKARLGRRAEALAELERLMDDLPPGEWSQRDARRRLEELFLRSDDLTGLVAYYEARLAKRPDDLAAVARLSHFLQSLGRFDDASRWLEDAVKACSRRRRASPVAGGVIRRTTQHRRRHRTI